VTPHSSTFRWLAAVVVALAAVLGAFGYLRLHEQPRFVYMVRPLSDADYAALAAKPGWREQRLTVATGVELRGLRREPARPGGPWILYFSGNSPRMLSESQQILDGLCAEQGWGGVIWAYRGYDSSAGAPDPAALTADGFTAYLQLLSEEKIQPSAVNVVGFSLGTSIAAAVAAQAHQQPPATLTLLAPMTVLYMGQRTQLRLDHYETSKWLERIASPTLVVHGAHDTTLKVEYARAVATALGSRARLLEMPDLGHPDLPMSQTVQAAVRAFISEHRAEGTTAKPAAP
jgi:pimeloyl-ACP methyl ester carboxylesterase